MRISDWSSDVCSSDLEIPEKDRRRPDVLFFLQRNPGYDQGDELVCLTELSLENQNPLAARIFAAGYARGLPATVAADSLTACRPRLAPLHPPCVSPGRYPAAPRRRRRGGSSARSAESSGGKEG